eukprot:00810.XXX_1712_2041_1 [CDS] Oithona nana genome sequencing.
MPNIYYKLSYKHAFSYFNNPIFTTTTTTTPRGSKTPKSKICIHKFKNLQRCFKIPQQELLIIQIETWIRFQIMLLLTLVNVPTTSSMFYEKNESCIPFWRMIIPLKTIV